MHLDQPALKQRLDEVRREPHAEEALLDRNADTCSVPVLDGGEEVEVGGDLVGDGGEVVVVAVGLLDSDDVVLVAKVLEEVHLGIGSPRWAKGAGK